MTKKKDGKPRSEPPAGGLIRERYASSKALSSNVGTVGLEFALSLIVGFAGGYWIDGRLDTSPYITILGAGFGLAAGIRALVRAARTMRRDAEREEREEGNPKPLFESNEERKARRKDEREKKEDASRAAIAEGKSGVTEEDGDDEGSRDR